VSKLLFQSDFYCSGLTLTPSGGQTVKPTTLSSHTCCHIYNRQKWVWNVTTVKILPWNYTNVRSNDHFDNRFFWHL